MATKPPAPQLPGMSVEAVFKTGSCSDQGKRVICNLGFTTFDVGMDFHDDVKCPTCEQTLGEGFGFAFM